MNSKYLLIGIDQCFVAVTGFSLTVIVTKLFGLEGLGLFVIAQTVLLSFVLVHAAFVCMPIATSFGVFDRESLHPDKDAYFSTSHLALTFLLLVTFILAVSLFKNSSLLSDVMPILYAIGSCVLPMLTFHYLRSIALASFDYVKVLKMDLVYGLTLISGVWFGGLQSIASILYLCSFSWILACFFGVNRKAFFFDVKQWRPILTRNLREGKWLFGFRVLAYFRGNLVIYILGFFWGISSVGMLRVVQSIFGPLTIFYASLESFMPQLGSRLYSEQGLSELCKFFGKVILIIGSIWVAYTSILILNYEFVLTTLFSVSDPRFEMLVFLQAIFMLVILINTIIPIVVRIAGETRSLTFTPIIEFSLLFVPGIFLVKNFSVEGTIAWQGLASFLSIAIMTIFFVRYRRG